MGRTRKVSDYQLREAIEAGLSGPEICAKHGITKSALSQRLSKLKLAASQAALLHQGRELMTQALDVRQRFIEISEAIRQNQELLRGRLLDENGKLDKGVVALLQGALAEERKQLEFVGKVVQEYTNAQRLEATKQRIIETITHACCLNCRPKVIRSLGELNSPGLLFVADGWT
jgi:hypothetical protein